MPPVLASGFLSSVPPQKSSNFCFWLLWLLWEKKDQWMDRWIHNWMNPRVHNSPFAGEDFSGAIQAGCCSVNTEIEWYPHYIQLLPHGSEGSWDKTDQRTAGQSSGENLTGRGMGFQTLANLNSLELWASTERPFLWLVSEQITGSCREGARKGPRQPGDPGSINGHAHWGCASFFLRK